MGPFGQLAQEFPGYRLTTFSPQSPAYWVEKLFGGGSMTASGVAVNADTALAIATVYASCRNLAEDIGSLPLPVYLEDTDGRKVRDRTSPAWRILNTKANPEMTAMSFREAIQGHVALRGDGFAEKQFDGAGRVTALWPLNPARMRMGRAGREFELAGAPDGALVYVYTLPSGRTKAFAGDLIFHLHGFGPNGMQGHSVVSLAREGMGLALATEKYGARFFANDARPGVVLKHPKTLSDKAKEHLADSYSTAHEGLDNAHRIAILEEGMDITAVGIPPVDAQFLETRKWQTTEISRWFRMPPDKIGDLERATFSNIEQSDINYVKYSIRTWCVRWEQQLAADGVVDTEHMAEHVVEGLLRGDAKTRAEYYHLLRGDGAISGEDIRRLENLPPSGQDAADELLVPLNMIPASSFGEDGMTMAQRVHAAFELVRAGYEASSVNAALGLPDITHTGFVPGTQTPDPSAAQ